MERSRIAIVIPAFNEEKTISVVVGSVVDQGTPIVVDDGSSDNTAEFARSSGAVVVILEKNHGYDFALNAGFSKAAEIGAEVIITMDADAQHDPRLIPEFVRRLDAGADMVIGDRSHRQRFSESLFAWYTEIRFGIHDPLCGMKAYRTSVYRLLGHFDSYGSIGTELMLFVAKNHLAVEQIPINVRNRDGESRFGKVLSGNYKILRAILLSFWRVGKVASSNA